MNHCFAIPSCKHAFRPSSGLAKNLLRYPFDSAHEVGEHEIGAEEEECKEQQYNHHDQRRIDDLGPRRPRDLLHLEIYVAKELPDVLHPAEGFPDSLFLCHLSSLASLRSSLRSSLR